MHCVMRAMKAKHKFLINYLFSTFTMTYNKQKLYTLHLHYKKALALAALHCILNMMRHINIHRELTH